MDENVIEELNKKKKIFWSIMTEIYYGDNFPDKKEKYSVEIRWADEEIYLTSIVITKFI